MNNEVCREVREVEGKGLDLTNLQEDTYVNQDLPAVRRFLPLLAGKVALPAVAGTVQVHIR